MPHGGESLRLLQFCRMLQLANQTRVVVKCIRVDRVFQTLIHWCLDYWRGAGGCKQCVPSDCLDPKAKYFV